MDDEIAKGFRRHQRYKRLSRVIKPKPSLKNNMRVSNNSK